MWPFIFGLFHLACFQGLSTCGVYVPPSFLWPNSTPWYGFATFCLFVHPLLNIWVGSSLGAAVNNTAVAVHLQDPWGPFVFSSREHIPRCRIAAGSYGKTMPTFLRNFQIIFDIFILKVFMMVLWEAEADRDSREERWGKEDRRGVCVAVRPLGALD